MDEVDWGALAAPDSKRRGSSRKMTDILLLDEDQRAIMHLVLQKGRIAWPEAAALLPQTSPEALQTLMEGLVAQGYLRQEGIGTEAAFVSQLSSRPGRQLSANIWQVLYEQVADVFDSEGETVALEGHRPLDLSDPEAVWLMRQGSANVFAVSRHAGGRRRFLFGIQTGQFLFGVGHFEHALKLVAVGMPGSHVLRLPLSRLRELLPDPRYRQQIATALDGWIGHLEPPAGVGAPRLFVPLTCGTEVDLGEGQCARPEEDKVSWVVVHEGTVVVSSYSERLAPSTPLPVTDRVWLTATAATRLNTWDTVTWLARNVDHWHTLRHYHARVLDGWAHQQGMEQEQEAVRLLERTHHDAQSLTQALSGLGNLFLPQASALQQASPVDPFMAVFRLLAEHEAISLTPEQVDGPTHHRGPWQRFEGAAERAHVRTRRISLKGRWWEHEAGAVAVRMRDSGQPVAVLTLEDGKNWVIDPANGTRQRLNATLAATLDTEGRMLVRSLGLRVVGLVDVFRFAIHGLKRELVLLVLLSLALGLLPLLTPIFTGQIFGHIIPGAHRGALWEVTLALIGSAVVTGLFQVSRGVAMIRMEGKMDLAVESGVWDRMMDLPVPFFSRYSAGDLVMRAMGVNAIRQMLTGSVLSSMLSGVFSIFSFLLLFYYSPVLALAATGLAIALTTVIFVTNWRLVRVQRQLLHIEGRLSGLVLQFFTGIAKLRVAAAEDRAYARWAEVYHEQQRMTITARKISNQLITVQSFFSMVSFVVLFSVTTLGVGVGVGTFLAFNAAFGQFVASLTGMGSTIVNAIQVVPIYERAKPILETLPEVDQAQADPGEITGAIEMSHVGFRYQADGPWILQDVSWQARPGEFIALVGASGSGKSTIMRLLLNFVQPDSGAVYVDGEDLRNLDSQAVRRQLGVVLQNGQLIQGDIYTNIVGAATWLTVEDAWEAARMVGLDEDIQRMPMGMYTYLSVGGGTLSGGQRQRILIARAIVNRPRILLFDEATSALDNRTQATIVKSVEALRATRIVIAHRLSTIMHADRIYVVDRGRIVQQGMYEELANVPGLFHALIQRQLA